MRRYRNPNLPVVLSRRNPDKPPYHARNKGRHTVVAEGQHVGLSWSRPWEQPLESRVTLAVNDETTGVRYTLSVPLVQLREAVEFGEKSEREFNERERIAREFTIPATATIDRIQVEASPVCEVCGNPRGRDGCTNGRCRSCHNQHCGPGGITEPGHGRGTVPTPFQRGAA
jgi:hypothetical protein